MRRGLSCFAKGLVYGVLVLILMGCPPSRPRTVTVPNVAGMTQAAAESAIVAANLTVGTVTTQASSTVAQGQVISQSPAAGASVTSGSAVNLTVSTGPAVATLPTHSFTVDTTLQAGTYLATSSVSVSNGATLTLEPGVTIIFQQGKEMTVQSTGRLSAVGTSTSPIVLTGEEAIRGHWGGLRFNQSNSLINRLEYVTIEYGGGYWDANLVVSGSSSSEARVDVVNCTLQQSESYGLYINEYGVVPEFSGNTITSNTLGAAQMAADGAGYLDDTSTYVGNDEDIVAIWGSSVDSDATWPGIDAVYSATGTITVDAALTLDPAVSIEFASGTQMNIDTDGSLIAIGTVDDPILLTGVEQVRGYWGGLRFNQTNAPDNQLDYVTIEYGGGYWEANLHITGSASYACQVAVTNCTLQESDAYGLYCNEYATITAFSGNTLTANTSGAAQLDADCAGYLDDTSTYVGNDSDVVEIWGSWVNSAATWPAIDASYFCDGSITVDAALTIAPGATILFDAGANMSVDSSGSLTAVGTAALPIMFSGGQEVAGYWGGLRINQSNSPSNQLDYVTIEYGGGYWEANLYIVGSSSYPAQATVTNCHISDSGEWGIIVDTAYATVNADIDTANTFANNASGDVSLIK